MQLASHIDWLLFTKRGYSLLKHLVPFSIAALLLIVVSVPNDNLLIKLANRLQQRSWLWLPAALLSLATATAYIATVSVQIRRAYLFKTGCWRRTIATAILYVTLGTAMAYAVLRSASPASPHAGTLWACLLLALLSLTGVGWSGPFSWVESIGIQAPDYTDSDQAVLDVTRVLNQVRQQADSNLTQVDDFSKGVEKVRTEIVKNLKYEPSWAQSELSVVVDKLRTLQQATKTAFPESAPNAIKDFAVASRGEKTTRYSGFINALNDTGQYWSAWKCS